MAPAQASKRAASAATAPPTKRARAIAGSKRRAAISAALEEAESLSAASRTTLAAIVPACLTPAPKERDEYLQKMVSMIGQALEEREATLVSELEEAKQQVEVVAEETASCAAKTTQLEEALTEKEEDVTTKRAALKGAIAAVEKCTTEHSEAKAAEGALQDELKEASAKKSHFVELIEGDFALLKDNPPTDKRVSKKHVATLMRTVETLAPGEALTEVAPLTMMKPPTQRGDFDKILVDFLGEMLRDEVAKQDAFITSGDQAASDRAAAVQAAQVARETAQGAEAVCKDELTSTEQAKEDLKRQLQAAKREAKELNNRTATAASDQALKESCLGSFREVLGSFAVERDGEPEPPALVAKSVERDGEPELVVKSIERDGELETPAAMVFGGC